MGRLFVRICEDSEDPSSPLTPLTVPGAAHLHQDPHGEGGVLRLAVVEHHHVASGQRHPGLEADLRLRQRGWLS